MVDFVKLAAPFPPTQVSWRVGATSADKKSGLALAYIDARDVMERLDGICGPAGWQVRYPHAGQKTVCEIGISIIREPEGTVEWIWKADGAGDTDVEGEKGALSDALKRAASRWGIGRYLYSLGNVWVQIEPAGRSFKIKASEEPKMIAALERLAKGLPAPPDIVAEARAINAEQSAERAQQGLKPLRKPNPSRKEWADYAIADIKEFDVEAIHVWEADNAAKMDVLFDGNHSLWVAITEARDKRLDALRDMAA